MMKAGAISRLDDVTKLLQTLRRNSQCRMHNSANRRTFFSFFPRSPQGGRFRVLPPGDF